MRVVVIGAGIVGITTAWWLHRAGHEVEVFTATGNGADRSTTPRDEQGIIVHRFDLGLPSLALLWTPTPGLQWHAGLSRSYRQPRMKDLSPNGRSTGDYNQPWYPDVRGNPALRNEVAQGLEAGLTQRLGPADWSLNLYARRIDDPIVFQVAQNSDGRWVLSPGNLSRARLQGVEVRGQIDLAALPAPQAPWASRSPAPAGGPP